MVVQKSRISSSSWLGDWGLVSVFFSVASLAITSSLFLAEVRNASQSLWSLAPRSNLSISTCRGSWSSSMETTISSNSVTASSKVNSLVGDFFGIVCESKISFVLPFPGYVALDLCWCIASS